MSIFDSATTGRLSLTYYQELLEDQYFESINRWHEDSSWPLVRFDMSSAEGSRTSSASSKPIEYFGAPSYLDIVNCVYGPGEKVVTPIVA
ncbi:type I-C CRISPR-associated protein Cas8c/Csd1 [Bifidobacterium sp. ESL0682]|uniref:type I-C CRISPR-associated protein Cas8c/Csd1 n=1 Tax=Bifidobacterium sp. ESL0682 TaxID=2983212 RepID=UPI0023F87156|nr:type I-C CRISPR-associated protein Cas8c/Csd1 [Bifidobacterium sp. ESL0682]WEV41497.1 type I-C CRISPR-associated protein Cas8c/Csd1 [Bifidobacterium sp. ESL0682]